MTATFADMNKSPGERLREIREARNLTLEQLGERVGTSGAQVHKLETGKLRLKVDWLTRFATALNIDAATLLQENDNSQSATPFDPVQVQDRGPRNLPILGAVVGGHDGYFEFNGTVSEYVERPSVLANVQGAYGVYMHGSSMEPKYEEGQLLYVHPHRPVRPRDYVIVELDTGEAAVKRLVRRTAARTICEQFNPPEQIEFDSTHIKRLHKVVHADELG